MSLDAPAGLFLALAIPAILLLWMLRPRRNRLRVPSLLLWAGSPAERQSARPWQRLRNHPLLWLQILAALLLALAAAQPYLPASAAGSHVLVLLDASGSMRAQNGEADRFAAARAAVLDIARGLGPGQDMTVLRVDDQPRVLVAGATTLGQVESALAGEVAAFGPGDVAAALALAEGLSRGPAEWVMVGDGGLAIPEGALRPAATHFRFVPVGGPAGNVAVTGLAAREGEGGVTLQAELYNTGLAPVEGSLQLLAEGELVRGQRWQLGPGEKTHVAWSHLPAGPRWYEVRLSGVEVAGNALAHDDRAWAVVGTASAPEVLLVSEGNSFLERVLGVHGELRAYRAAPDDWPGLAAQGEAYPLTILDRLWPQTPPRGSALLIGPPVGDAFRPGQMWPRPAHPLLRHVDWSEVQVASARRLPLGPEWEVVIDSDGGPLLAIREEGGRRQAALAFDLAQSDLALRPAFPVLMANLLDWLLARPDTATHVVAPGATVSLPASPLAREVWVEAVDGRRYDLAPPFPPLPFRPPDPGLYRVVQAGEAGRQESLLVAGGYHALEADLTPRSLDLPAAEGGLADPARAAQAFWPWLAALALLVSTLEWWVDARGR